MKRLLGVLFDKVLWWAIDKSRKNDRNWRMD
jgi:hypothetical protein